MYAFGSLENQIFPSLYQNAEETYNATLNSVKQSFPQYVRELEGIADGAQVEFHKVSK